MRGTSTLSNESTTDEITNSITEGGNMGSERREYDNHRPAVPPSQPGGEGAGGQSSKRAPRGRRSRR